MSDDNIPSKDPAADSSMGAMLRQTITKLLQQVDGMLPATVVSYNRQTNRATVVPAINMITTGGESLARAPFANIPVLALGGGDLFINFPLKAGDSGWIEASDRDISLWLQGGGNKSSWPNTHRIHSFSDGRFIPDVLSKYNMPSGVADDEMVISNMDGTSIIAIGPNRVAINSVKVQIYSTAQVEILSGAGTKITGGLTVDGIPFNTHKHTGVQTGSGTTGGPTA